jgi:hypothetical protein
MIVLDGRNLHDNIVCVADVPEVQKDNGDGVRDGQVQRIGQHIAGVGQ